ncbi:ankyrin repeat-containing domain protein [Phycomyces nitens]|nr:ankyrin repeat-containing domain protein [Phycomyces nitens]
MTTISTAAYQGKLFIVKSLLEKTDGLNSKDEDGRTALHWAASGGHVDVVQFLLEKGALTLRDEVIHDIITIFFNIYIYGYCNTLYPQSGWTPLMIAASAGHEKVVELLLEHGSDPLEQNESGQTALHYAASKNKLEYNANPNQTNNMQQTPLHRAASQGYTAIVKVLIGSKARVNVRDQLANTPLHLACEEGHGDTAELLIQHGARADQPNRQGQTALDLCDATLRAYLDKPDESL